MSDPPLSPSRGLGAALAPLLLQTLLFFFMFSTRMVLAPMLLALERDLGLNHAQSAGLFLFITLGYVATMLASGLISSRLTHRWTMALGGAVGIVALLAVAASRSLTGLRLALLLVGVGPGLYFPSALPTLTSLVEPASRGKALAVHELAPNLGLVVVPLLVAMLLSELDWRRVVILFAAGGALISGAFTLLGRGGSFGGEPPRLPAVRRIAGKGSFWALAMLFGVAIGSSVGVFSIAPTFLAAEKGFSPRLASALVGLSRLTGLPALFLAGTLVDRLGYRVVMGLVLAATGAATVALGLASGTALLVIVFLQPILVASFFPAGFVALAEAAGSANYNVEVSLVIPFAYLFGSGVVPALLGAAAQHRSFAFGLVVLGALITACAVTAWALRPASPACGPAVGRSARREGP